MQIEVKLYGDLKKYAPHDQTNFMLMLTPGATVGDILAGLKIPPDARVPLINGRHAADEAQLEHGTTLVLLPPIAGG